MPVFRMFKKAFSHPPNPARAETRAFPWRGRSERGGVNPLHPRGATGTQDVEPLSDAIDPLQQREQLVPRLEAFFNILLGIPMRWSGTRSSAAAR